MFFCFFHRIISCIAIKKQLNSLIPDAIMPAYELLAYIILIECFVEHSSGYFVIIQS